MLPLLKSGGSTHQQTASLMINMLYLTTSLTFGITVLWAAQRGRIMRLSDCL
jgi:hypothetical protein